MKKFFLLMLLTLVMYFAYSQEIDLVQIEETRLDSGQLVNTFLISSTEITVEQYVMVRGENRFITLTQENRLKPVVMVRWYDAAAFCSYLAEKQGLEPYYLFFEDRIEINEKSNGYRLPSENEYLAIKESGESISTNIGDYAWYKGNSNLKIHNVAEKNPDSFGLYDIWGNAWEYCDNNYTGERVSIIGLKEKNTFQDIVIRGGCITDEASVVLNERIKLNIFNRIDDVGFRIVKIGK